MRKAKAILRDYEAERAARIMRKAKKSSVSGDPMFRSLCEEIEAACQENDRLRLEFEQHERQWAERARRSAPAEIVHKTYEPRSAQQQPQQRAVMDDATAKTWNDWLSSYVWRSIKEYHEELHDGIAEAFSIFRGEERKLMREHVAAELAKLRDEIGALREELTHLRGDVALGVRVASGKIPGLIRRNNVPVRRGHNGIAHR
jgi:hypothetical protein